MKFNPREKSQGVGANSFLKFDKADEKGNYSHSGLFLGDPFEFYVVWDEGVGRSKVVEKGTPKAKYRFRINFVIKENGAFVSRVFEAGGPVYDMLEELHNEYGLEQTAVKITKRGAGKETKYTIIALPPKSQPSKEQLKAMLSVPLLDMGNGVPAHGDLENNHDSGDDDADEIPF